jgi:GntR family transcriptional regulator, transcriptional repressor for pyruvate dehydrogenase complex
VAPTSLHGPARSAVFAPVGEGGRADAVARRIGEAIRVGLLADGEQLPSEAELTAQLAVATVTVREALARLRDEGLIETRRGRGGGSFARSPVEGLAPGARARLLELTVDELRDLGDHHGAVAGAAARLAAARAGQAELVRLRLHVDRLAAAGTAPERQRADSRFHVEVAASGHSARLTREEIMLQTVVGPLSWLAVEDRQDTGPTVLAHRAMLSAIEAGDGERARRLAEDHVAEETRWLVELHMRLVEQQG